MATDIKKKIKRVRNRAYLAKDFSAMRADLLNYARTYFPDKIQDFSEASLGGLLLDMAAMVGDTMSYYLDHQFNELDWSSAVEIKNIQTHLKNAGVNIRGTAPASVNVKYFIEVPAENGPNGGKRPRRSALPVILEGTRLEANNGIVFNLTEKIDFSIENSLGELIADVQVATKNDDGSPASYFISKQGMCVSGDEVTESIVVSANHVPFRTITLSNTSISEILSVTDSDGNDYYEVDALAQDTVFKGVPNLTSDNNIVEQNMEVIAAPYRFIRTDDLRSRSTQLQFGAGDADSLDDDIIPDPSELAFPLYGKKTFTKFTIDPGSLLKTQTLGISPKSTTLSVNYRHGGGLNHNVAVNTIRTILTLKMEFEKNPSDADARSVRMSADTVNDEIASGGSPAPTIEELRQQIPIARQLQARVVTKQDLLGRVYTIPNRFGRVYRAGIRDNLLNPMATQLFILTKDSGNNLSYASDSLKINLQKYLNEFRLISDAIDILDGIIINFGINFSIIVRPGFNKDLVISEALGLIADNFDVAKFQIDQPIVLNDIKNIIMNTPGVLSLTFVEVVNLTGQFDDRRYSRDMMNIKESTRYEIIVGPPGSIFELKFPTFDIKGTAL